MIVERYAISERQAWLALRQADLTASDIGAAIGIDRFKSPLRLYAEKAGLLLADEESPIMRRGRWLEAAAVDALREENPTWDILRPAIYLREPQFRLGATPDCLAENPDDPGLINIQIKAVSRPVFERDWADSPPMPYLLQTLCEGMLLDAARSYLAALVIDTYSARLEMRPVPRHAAAEERIKEIAVAFWANIAAGRRPRPDYENDGDTIAALFPKAVSGPPLDLSRDNRMPDLLNQRAALKTALDNGHARMTAIENEIKLKLGDAETAALPGWRISWKEQTRKAYSVAETSFRRLTITEDNAA